VPVVENDYGVEVTISDVVDPNTGDFDGRQILIDYDQDLEGKPALVYVWLTRCPVCRRVTPSVVELDRRFGPRGLKIVGAHRFEPGITAWRNSSNQFCTSTSRPAVWPLSSTTIRKRCPPGAGE